MKTFAFLLATCTSCIGRLTFLKYVSSHCAFMDSITVNQNKENQSNNIERIHWLLSSNKKVKSYVVPLTFKEAVLVIKKETPKEFFQEVLKSGNKFLYRGENIDISYNYENSISKKEMNCAWMSPEPDLLLQGTYPDDNALMYFQNLEKYLNAKQISTKEINIARPSTAHIGTSDIEEASKWGQSVSIWPCGENFSYCFPQSRRNFFNGGLNSPSCDQDAFGNGVIINKDLSTALAEKKEVMFSSTDKMGYIFSSYVAIPSKYDDQIRSILL